MRNRFILYICKYLALISGIVVALYFALRFIPPDLWSDLDNIGIVTGFVTMVFSIITWIKVDSLKSLKKKNRDITVYDDDVIIAVETGSNNMDGQVKTFALANKNLKTLENKEIKHRSAIVSLNSGSWSASVDDEFKRLISIKYDGKVIEDVAQGAEDIRFLIDDVCDVLRADGVRGIHFFYNGIGVYNIFIGDCFANNFRVSVYHLSNGSYIKVGELGGVQ